MKGAIEIIKRSRQRLNLLETTVRDIDDMLILARGIEPAPDRWRESAILRKLEIARARILAEEDFPSQLPLLQARRAIEEARHD